MKLLETISSPPSRGNPSTKSIGRLVELQVVQAEQPRILGQEGPRLREQALAKPYWCTKANDAYERWAMHCPSLHLIFVLILSNIYRHGSFPFSKLSIEIRQQVYRLLLAHLYDPREPQYHSSGPLKTRRYHHTADFGEGYHAYLARQLDPN